MRACVLAGLRACVYACMRACVRACVRPRACTRASANGSPSPGADVPWPAQCLQRMQWRGGCAAGIAKRDFTVAVYNATRSRARGILGARVPTRRRRHCRDRETRRGDRRSRHAHVPVRSRCPRARECSPSAVPHACVCFHGESRAHLMDRGCRNRVREYSMGRGEFKYASTQRLGGLQPFRQHLRPRPVPWRRGAAPSARRNAPSV